MRLVTDLFEYAQSEMPEWNTDLHQRLSHPRGRGHRRPGAGLHDCQWPGVRAGGASAAGLDVDEFAPRLSFFWNGHSNFFEEVAKYPGGPPHLGPVMKETIGAADPRIWAMRFHTQTAGSTLTAQQPVNNVVRTTLQALAAVLGGTQSLHTNSYDEALGLPTDESALLALRTQQMIAYETGVADTVDPLAGSYFVEYLTDQLEAKAEDLIDQDRGARGSGGGHRGRVDAGSDRGIGLSARRGASRRRARSWSGSTGFRRTTRRRFRCSKSTLHWRKARGAVCEQWRAGRDGVATGLALEQLGGRGEDGSNLLPR